MTCSSSAPEVTVALTIACVPQKWSLTFDYPPSSMKTGSRGAKCTLARGTDIGESTCVHWLNQHFRFEDSYMALSRCQGLESADVNLKWSKTKVQGRSAKELIQLREVKHRVRPENLGPHNLHKYLTKPVKAIVFHERKNSLLN